MIIAYREGRRIEKKRKKEKEERNNVKEKNISTREKGKANEKKNFLTLGPGWNSEVFHLKIQCLK